LHGVRVLDAHTGRPSVSGFGGAGRPAPSTARRSGRGVNAASLQLNSGAQAPRSGAVTLSAQSPQQGFSGIQLQTWRAAGESSRSLTTLDINDTRKRSADTLLETANMEINRNQWFMIGLVILALGIQFRAVEAFVLNEETTKILAKRLKKDKTVTTTFIPSFEVTPPPSRRTIEPPRWLGFMMISAGAVLVLHSLAMPRPG